MMANINLLESNQGDFINNSSNLTNSEIIFQNMRKAISTNMFITLQQQFKRELEVT